MDRRLALVKIGVAFLLISTMIPFASACSEQPSSLPRESEGGHAVLVEQYTSTWCEFCAEVDPWVEDVMQDHSGRAYRIAIHPDDSDPLGNPAATHRLLRHNDPSNQSLPTFWYDGAEGSTGVVQPWRVSQGIIAAEDDRSSSTQFNVQQAGLLHFIVDLRFQMQAEQYSGTQVTVILKDSMSRLSGSEAANGITEHRDVVVGLVEIDISEQGAHIAWAWPHPEAWLLDNSSFNQNQRELHLQLPDGNWDLPTDLEVIFVHESDVGGDDTVTYGVLGLEYQGGDGGGCGGVFAIGYNFLTMYPLQIVLVVSLLLLLQGRRRVDSHTKDP